MRQKKLDNWIESEFNEVKFSDLRLKERFNVIMNNFMNLPSSSICGTFSGNWHDTKAAYRFISNQNVDMKNVFDHHKKKTLDRAKNVPGHLFAIEDTTYFNFAHHPKTKGLGNIATTYGHIIPGIVLHTTLLISHSGVPLGILDHQIYCREKRIGNHKIIPITEKESYRWVKPLQELEQEDNIIFICDRESDIHEFYEECEKRKLKFLVRARGTRILLDEDESKNGENLLDKIRNSKERGTVDIIIPANKKHQERKASLGIYYEKIKIKAPQRLHQRRGENLDLTVLRLYEKKEPKEGERLEWILLTNMEINNTFDAQEKALWYKHRWHIENYHKVLKSKCKIEDARLETASRLKTYISMKSIIALRLYQLTHIARVFPNESCELVFEEHEWKALYWKLKRKKPPQNPISLKDATAMVGQLGGYLNRNTDPPHGVVVIGRGMERLGDIVDDYLLFMGNR